MNKHITQREQMILTRHNMPKPQTAGRVRSNVTKNDLSKFKPHQLSGKVGTQNRNSHNLVNDWTSINSLGSFPGGM